MPDDDLDLIVRRRKQKQAKTRQRLILAGILGGGLLAAVGVVVGIGLVAKRSGRDDRAVVNGANVNGPGFFGPSAGSEGEKWTHVELRDYLRSKGLKVRMEPNSGGVWFVFAVNEQDEADALSLARDNITDPRIVDCDKIHSADSAREMAGRNPEGTFAWGRFLFQGSRRDQTNLNAIRKVLTGGQQEPSRR